VASDRLGRRGRLTNRLPRGEVEDLVAVVRDERATVGAYPKAHAKALGGELPFEDRSTERDHLDRDRRPLPERPDELRRVHHDHDGAREAGEQLLAEESPPSAFRHVEGRGDLVRTVEHEVELVVASEGADRNPELPGELFGRAGARDAVELPVGETLGDRPDGLGGGGARPEGEPKARAHVVFDRVAGGDALRTLEVLRHVPPEARPLFNPAPPGPHTHKPEAASLSRMAPAPPSDRVPVVVSVGGSILLTGSGDREYFERLADLLRRLGGERPLVVTTGGGRTAREYIQLGRALGLTEVELDEVGIEVTRLHARLLAARIGPPAPAHPPTTVPAVVEQLRTGSPVVLGGTEPGHTTDGVAALVAVRIRAGRVVNATDVEGVYDRDPHTHPDAHRIERLTWPEFRGIVHAGTSGEAGQNFLFDRLGADALARAHIPLLIVPGRDLENLEAAISGRPCRGSRIGDPAPEKTP